MDEPAASTTGLRVLAADEDHEALQRFGVLVESLGHEVIATAVDLAETTEVIAREDPDLSVVVVHEDDEHALALIEEVGAFARGPVIAMLEEEDAVFVARAADRGIAAWGRPTSAEALQSAIEVALRRHAELERLSGEVAQLQSALERRAVIERAKGILMERHGLAERDAFERIRSHARSGSIRVVDVAQRVAERELEL
ncbi:ANTAR domain-containing response regulator [Conexibacter sp. SYSU D00693]|uniref:ANTAR domain-containing response regulator n=1 Tax=Conexibacter sp. SYSU D00693 TaxID=2812560 RepID=UPI00196A303F|nr:ANTAR domain-containing protein [Conexibacter sp. SYSU D00693]